MRSGLRTWRQAERGVTAHVGAGALARPAEQSSAVLVPDKPQICETTAVGETPTGQPARRRRYSIRLAGKAISANFRMISDSSLLFHAIPMSHSA